MCCPTFLLKFIIFSPRSVFRKYLLTRGYEIEIIGTFRVLFQPKHQNLLNLVEAFAIRWHVCQTVIMTYLTLPELIPHCLQQLAPNPHSGVDFNEEVARYVSAV